jgi:hypothetical protein
MATSMTGGLASRSLASSSSSGVMPMPESSISSITPPVLSVFAVTVTRVSGAENEVAFSSSSATRWTRSLTTRPTTLVSGRPCSWTRSYCSTSEAPARSTSSRRTAWLHLRPGSSPARTSRFSPLRRIRVARWSSLKRLASWSGSCSEFSSSSISRSWRWTSDWERRERLTNIELTFARSIACSEASRTACWWTSSKDRATSPISSEEVIGIGSTRLLASAVAASASRSRRTISGSRVEAMSRAAARSMLSGPVSERATKTVPTKESSSAKMITPMFRYRSLSALSAGTARRSASGRSWPPARCAGRRGWWPGRRR